MDATPTGSSPPPEPGTPDIAASGDSDRRRRQQRRRALIGWIGGLGVIALIALGAVLGGDDNASVHVPYGELMTSSEFESLDNGEEEFDVLTDLDKTGRPESATKNYVLILFPPADDDVRCTYWEFTDEPEIFARLCFADGELVEKLKRDVHQGLVPSEGTVV